MRRWVSVSLGVLVVGVLGHPASAADYAKVTYVRTAAGDYGDCIYLELPNGKNVLIDGGGTSSNTGLLAQFLDSKIGQGGTIWFMVLSHPHADHVRGLNMALDRYVVKHVYDTGTNYSSTDYNTFKTKVTNEGADFFHPNPGDYLSGPNTTVGPGWASQVAVRTLAADDTATADANARSLVLKAKMGTSSWLFGGDATGGVSGGLDGVEKFVYDNYLADLQNTDIFKVHHHGSASSNGTTFLQALAPKYAVIQMGDSAPNHPFRAALDRLLAISPAPKIYRMDLDRAVVVKADDKGNYNIVREQAYSAGGGSGAGVAPPPTVPGTLGVTGRTNTTATLDWPDNPSSEAITGYDVFRGTGPSGDTAAGVDSQPGDGSSGIYKKVTSSPVVSSAYTDTGLASGKAYWYRVVAVSTNSYERRYSNEVSTTTTGGGPTPPNALTDLAATSGPQHGEVRLTWTAPGDDGTTGQADRYVVAAATYAITLQSEFDAAPKITQDWVPLPQGQPENHVAGGLTVGTTYYVALEAVDILGNQASLSNTPVTALATVDGAAPAGITNLSAVMGTGVGTITLSWTAPGDDGSGGTATTYLVKYATTAIVNTAQFDAATTYAQVWVPLGAGQSESRTLFGLSGGTLYYVAVKARDEAGNLGALSNAPVSATARPAADHVVIAEVAASGASGETDEYLMLYNPTGSTVTITSWDIQKKSASGTTWSTIRTFPTVDLPAGKTYLVARTTAESGDYRVPFSGPTPDLTFSGVYDNVGGHLRIRDSGNTVIDTVGWGTANAPEGSAAPTPESNGAIVRLGATAYEQDTDNNAADFVKANRRPQSLVAPRPPENLQAAAGDQRVDLAWDANAESDLAKYSVYRATLSGGPYSVVAALLAPGTTHRDGGLTNGANYFYYVTAVDNTGSDESQVSNQVVATPQPPPPPPDTTAPAAVTNLSGLSGVANGTIRLSWTAPGDDGTIGQATRYIIRYGTAGVTDATWGSATDVSNEPSPGASGTSETLTVGSLTPATTYYFAMKTEDEVPNTSALSNGTSALATSLSSATTDHLVISQVSPGTVSAPEEFVELYNPTAGALTVSASTVKLKFVNSTNGVTTKTLTFTNTSIPAKGYFLLASSASIGGVGADATFSAGLTGTSGVILTDQNSVVIDKVGWGTGTVSNSTETTKVSPSTNLGTGDSVERKAYAGATAASMLAGGADATGGNGYDTNDNANDFVVHVGSYTPQNSASPTEPPETDTTPPAVPSGLGVANPAIGSRLNLNWTANSEGDLKDYRVYRSTWSSVLGDKGNAKATILSPGTTHQDSGLNNGTTYYYQLTARDTSLNESGGSAEESGHPTDTTPPAAPTGLTASDPGTGNRINLAWTANTETDLKDYRMYRATFSGGVTTKASVATIGSPGTTHQDGGLVDGVTSYYQITARDGSLNESSASGEASAVPRDITAPANVTDPSVTAAPQGGELEIAWSNPSDADFAGTRVRWSTVSAPGGPTAGTLLVDTTQTAVIHTGLTNGTTYYYALFAYDEVPNYSAGVSTSGVPQDIQAPSIPTGLTVADAGDQQVDLRWVANGDDAKDYRVYRSTNAGVTQVSSHVAATLLVPGTTHRDGGLVNQTTYYYRLSARDSSLNESGLSVEVSTYPRSVSDTTPPASPTGLGVADVAGDEGGALRLSWAANTESDLKDYGVYRSTAAGQAATAATRRTYIVSPGTTHQEAGLANGTTYYYRLTARDTSLNESASTGDASSIPYDNLAPSAPAGLAASNTLGGADVGGRLTLTWTANPEGDVKDYRVYRSTNAGVTQVSSHVITAVASPGTTHQDAGLGNGTTQYYRLSARDTSTNESGLGAEGSGYPQDSVAPSAPTGLGAADVPSDQGGALRLSWAANTEGDLKDYGVYRATFSGALGTKALVTRVATPGTTHQDAGLNNGATSYYQVTARDVATNESGESAQAQGIPYDNLAPAAPGAPAVSNTAGGANVGNRLSLNWAANTEGDLKDYRVYRSTNAGVTQVSSHVLTAVASPGTTHQDAGLGNGTTQYYRLSARDTSTNESGLGAEGSGYPQDSVAPSAPAGLGAADVPSDQGGALRLSWTANTEADLKDYRVYRSTNLGVTQVSSHVVTAVASPGTTHQDGGLANGTTVYYRLTAQDTSLNESGLSAEASGYPADNLAPAAPAGLGAADVGGDQGTALSLSWTANTEGDLKDYRVFRSTTGNVTVGSSWTVTLATLAQPGTTHQDTGLTPVTTYYFKVTARDTSGNESAASGEVNLRPADNLAPAAPGSPTVADVPADEGGALRLNWALNTETDVREYGVYRSTTGNVTAGSSWTVLVTLVLSPGTTRQDGGLGNGTTYYYKLSARDTSGNESGLSAEASGIPSDNTAPGIPASLTVGDPGTTALTLNWTANTEGDLKDYRVYRSTNAGVTLVSSHTLVSVASPGTTHQDGGLTAGVRYNYRVTARDTSENESGGSAEVSGVPGAPAAPAGLGVADVGGDQGTALTLSWTANTEGDLKDYRVFRSTTGNVTVGSSWTVTLATLAQPGTTHQDTGLTPVTTYYFKVTARDTGLNESAASTEVNLRPADNVAPTAPGSPTVADVPADGGGALRLNWALNTETDVREYGVYRSTTGNVTVGSSWTVLVTLVLSPGTTRQDAGLGNGTTYYYKLSARDTSGNESGLSTEASGIPSDNTAPAAPAGLTVGDPGTTVLNLTWTANTEGDLKDYRVYRSTNSGVTLVSSHTLVSVASPGTTHQDGGLTAGTRYNYRLTARDTSGNESAGSAEVSGVPGAPAAPAGLGVADVGGDQGTALTLSWTANTEADLKDYRVFRSTTGNVTVGSSWTVTLATIVQPGTTHQDTGLTPVTTYYFKVTARDTGLNESAASTEVNLRPADNLAPAAPGGLTVGDPGTTGLNLNWTVNTETDVREYVVYRSTNAGVTLVSTHVVVSIASPGTTHQDGGLTAGTRYNYRLAARDTSGNESAGSAEVSGVPGAPAAPTGLGVANPGLGQRLNLSWTANTESDLTDYRVYRSTNAGVTQVSSHVLTAVASPGTTHQDGGLADGATYYYKVSARDTAGNESGLSGEASGVTEGDTSPPAAPTGLGVTDVPTDEGGALRLSWTASTEPDLKDYGIYRATYSGTLSEKSLQTRIVSPGTTHQEGGLNNDVTYYYQVTARDTSGNESGGSSQASSIPVDNVAPAAPTGLGGANEGRGERVNLSWAANSEGDLKDYELYRSTWSSGVAEKTLLTRIAAPGTTHHDAGLANGTSYYYQLTARDASLNVSAASAEVSATPSDTTAPAAITDLAGTPGTAVGELKLTWTARGEDGDTGTATVYVVRYATTPVTDTLWPSATDATGEPTPGGPGTNESFTLASLAPGSTYYMALKVRDAAANESALSNGATAPAEANAGPATHLVVSEVCGGTTQADLEYVELYNPTTSAITISDATFKLKLVNSSNQVTTKNLTYNVTSVPAKGFYLLASTSPIAGLTADAVFGAQLTGSSGVLITDQNDVVIDKVGWGTGGASVVAATEGLRVEVSLGTGDSVERKAKSSSTAATMLGGGADATEGNAHESDNNTNDFVVHAGSFVPQNTSSPLEPPSGDATAPAAVTDLAAQKGTSKGEVKLTWTAPGDDGNSGTAATYIVRYATYAITADNWAQATDVAGEPAPVLAGTVQSMTVGNLTVGTTYHFALKTQDEVPNTSGLSNVPSSRPKGFTNPGHVVISEIQIGGTTAADEFVELYNPTASSINMNNWKLTRKNSAGTENNLVATFGNWTIAAGGYFLIAHNNYDGAVARDQGYSNTTYSIAASACVILYSDGGTTVVDKVGFGVNADSETATIGNPATDGSVERKPGATAPSDGNGEDTDDNSVDYAQRTTSDPQNSGSSAETAPAKPLLPNDPLAEDLSDLGGPSAFTIGPNPGTGRSPASVYFVTGWSAFTVEARIYNSVGELVSAMEGAGSQVAQRVGHASPGYQRGRYAMALGAGGESGQPLASGVYVLRLRLVNPETGEVVPYTRKFIVIR